MSDTEAEGEKKKEKKKKDEPKEGEEGDKKEEDKKEDDTESLSRSIMDYLMPAKDMVAKMTVRRKYVIISEEPDPEYMDQLEEDLIIKADALAEEIYHFSLEGNLQRDRITRYLHKSTKHTEFPYIFVNGEFFETLERFQKYADRDTLHSKVHGIGRDWDVQTGSVSFAVNSAAVHWAQGVAALRRSAEKRGIIEVDNRSEQEILKEKRKKAAAAAKKRKQKERDAKKQRIKRKLAWKAKKKAIRLQLATIGINLPQEDKQAKAKRRKKKKQEKAAKAKVAKEKKAEKEKSK